MGRRLRRLVGRLAFYALVAIIVLYTVFPFYWAIVSSLRTGSNLFSTALVPLQPAWSNYVAVFREQPFARNIANSLFVAVSTVAVSLALAVAAAYPPRRLSFPRRRALPVPVPRVSMFPP